YWLFAIRYWPFAPSMTTALTTPPESRLDAILARHAGLTATLAQGADGQAYVAASRELAELDPVVGAINEFRAARKTLADLDDLLADPTTDAEMRALAQEERPHAETEVGRLGQTLRLLLIPKDEADEKSAILEIRAGTGGDEAALFAGDLFEMYRKYA